MITAIVTADLEAVLMLKFRGANGIEAGIQVTIDTGFSESVSLPQTWIDALACPYRETGSVTLADGSRIQVDLYEGLIVWDGQEKAVLVHCMEGSPLIGMSLMIDYLLHLPVRVNSPVTLNAIP